MTKCKCKYIWYDLWYDLYYIYDMHMLFVTALSALIWSINSKAPLTEFQFCCRMPIFQTTLTQSIWFSAQFLSVLAMKCPKDSQYELCADTCSTTCASLTTPQKCSHCQEGCECVDRFAFDAGTCKPFGKCGCVADGRYYKVCVCVCVCVYLCVRLCV